jgi:hypothetical protein
VGSAAALSWLKVFNYEFSRGFGVGFTVGLVAALFLVFLIAHASS